MNKIKIESGEYTAYELRNMADNMEKEWPIHGCKYWIINRAGIADIYLAIYMETLNLHMKTFGIYKEKPSEEEVKMVMRRREILNTWKFHEVIDECGLPEDPSLHDEFAEVMSYPYTHHTVK